MLLEKIPEIAKKVVDLKASYLFEIAKNSLSIQKIYFNPISVFFSEENRLLKMVTRKKSAVQN